MKRTMLPVALAAALILAAGGAFAQAAPEDHDAHHPGAESEPAAPIVPDAATGPEAPAASKTGMMEGGMTGMMTPEMMTMMRQMMDQGGMPGMMRPGAGAMMACPMRSGGAPAPMDKGIGPAALYGMAADPAAEMTSEGVRAYLRAQLDAHANPRLKLGEISAAADGSIVAEIVTTEGALVQRLAFNRHPGLFRQLVD